MDGFQKHKDDYYFDVDPLTREKTLKPAVQNYLQTGQNKPSYYYDDFTEYTQQFFSMDETINESNVKSSGVLTFNKSLSNEESFKNFINSKEGQDTIINFKNSIIESETFEKELEKEFRDKDFSRVDSEGNYFVNKGIDEKDLQDMGLDILKGNYLVGYNVISNEIVFKPTDLNRPIPAGTSDVNESEGFLDFVFSDNNKQSKPNKTLVPEDIVSMMGLELNENNLKKINNFISNIKNTNQSLRFRDRPFVTDIIDFIYNNVDDTILQQYNPDLDPESTTPDSGLNKLRRRKAVDTMLKQIIEGLNI